MKTVCKKNLEVFDFKEEKEEFELARRIKSKLENPNNAIDKYTFLATAAAGKGISGEETNYVPSLGIDAINIDRFDAINIDHIATTLVEEDSSARMMPDSDDAFRVAEQPSQSSPELRTDLSGSEVIAPVRAVVNAPGGAEITDVTPSGSPSSNKLNSDILDLLPSLCEHNETVEMDPDENRSMCERSSSTSEDAEDDGVLAGASSDHCIDGWEMENEDLTTVVFYPDYMVYRDSYYTDSFISFTSSFIEMEGSTTDDDEKFVKCKWEIDDIIHIRSIWHERVEMAMVKIHVLAKDTVETENVECTSGIELKFAVIGSDWYGRVDAVLSLNVIYKALWSSMIESGDTEDGHFLGSFIKYLPNFDQPFEEVVYPKGEADAVSISKRDFDLLQPDTFVNDTIIDFYIKYLKNKINPEERHRFHFFNSFFFRKLVDPDKDKLNASEGRAAFQRVKKWTRKVNLFEKDYVFIPVNYNYHWSLIVICHLGDVATNQDEDANESIKMPCILHMDSIRGSHTGFKGLVQSYLREEWKERKQETSEDVSSRFDNLRFISLELPQQQNSYDCGLFLLHYVELFLEQAPLHFNPFKITNNSNFLNVDWFPPSEASLKRVIIQKLICDLLENPYEEPPSTAGNDDERCNTNIHKGSVVNSSNSLMSTQSSEAENDFNQTMAFNEYKSPLTPIEEDVEGGGQFVYSEMEPWHPHFGSSQETSTSGCDDSIEIIEGINSEKMDEARSPLTVDIPNEHVEMVNGADDDDDDLTSSMDILPDKNQAGPTGSDDSSGPETKKMRMTQL